MAEFLTDDEASILEELQKKIMHFESRNRLRRNYFEGEDLLVNLGFSIPDGMQSFQSVIGWPRKAVSVFASRLQPAGYTSGRAEDGLVEEIEDILAGSMFEMLERLAIEAACRYGVSFIFTSLGDTSIGEPDVIASVRSARSATVDMDFRTWRVRSALEKTGPRSWNLYLPHRVLMIERRGGRWIKETVPTGTPRVQCAPYIQGSIIGKELGQSRITRPLMGFTDAGVRTLLRQEVSAEFYSAPRQALLGADESMFMDKDGNVRPGWLAVLGGMWGIPDPIGEDNTTPDPDLRPEFHSFPQMSMQPFSDQFRMIAQMVSGETSIPPSYLGVVADSNPTSAQAIFANEIDLISEVKSQWPSFNLGRLQLAKNVFSLVTDRDLTKVETLALSRLKPRWADPRTRSVQEQSQFVAQQVSSGNFQAGSETTLRQLPIDPEDITLFASEARRGSGLSILSELASSGVSTTSTDGSRLDDQVKEANAMKARLDALGVGVRAGATFDSLRSLLGLDGVENSGAIPAMLRMPENEAAGYEGG